ncbi:MAG: LptF/LptG family permease [Pseudomonadota bacterium]
MTRLERYIARQWLAWFFVFGIIFCAAIWLIDLVEQARTVGTKANVALTESAVLAALKLPMLFAEVLPFLILATTIITYARLGRRKELPVIQTSGLSSLSVLRPAMILTLLIGVLNITLLNPYGAETTASFEEKRAAALRGSNPKSQLRPIWLREQQGVITRLISASQSDMGEHDFSRISIIEIDMSAPEGAQFQRRIEAETGFWADNVWHLSNVSEQSRLDPPGHFDAVTLPSEQDPSRLLSRTITRKTVGFWDLPREISLRAASGQSVGRFVMRLFELLASPLHLLAMALIGGMACLRLDRLGQTTIRIAVSSGAALVLFLSVQFGISLGASGQLPIILAAFGPPVAACLIALTLLTSNMH